MICFTIARKIQKTAPRWQRFLRTCPKSGGRHSGYNSLSRGGKIWFSGRKDMYYGEVGESKSGISQKEKLKIITEIYDV